MTELTLYGRRACHLCAAMRAGLTPLQAELGFGVVEVDIDMDPELVRRYGHLVPVLVLDGVEVCHHFLDAAALRSRLATA